ncbi:MAG: hypothetical protein H7X85_09360 [Thermoanaerobaculia bacterium]|nr:hypothetical protein [Thermoanaerobaculia bacterium]
MPQLLQPAAARPLLSVVFPLLDERGLALACIRGWVEEKQEVPLQLVVVSDRLFWNGKPIPASGVAQTEDGLEFVTPHGTSRRDGTQTIGIVCRPYLPRRSGLPDPRRLGLLLFRTELTAVPAAAEAPAFSRAGRKRDVPASLRPTA